MYIKVSKYREHPRDIHLWEFQSGTLLLLRKGIICNRYDYFFEKYRKRYLYPEYHMIKSKELFKLVQQ